MNSRDDRAALDTVLVPRKGLTVVPVEDELVVYDRSNGGSLHRLDARATLVWRLLDGTATARQTAEEIAEAVGADSGQVTADVATLVGELSDLALVVPVGAAPSRSRPRSAAAPADDDPEEDDPAAQPTGGVLRMRRTPCFLALEAEGWHATDALAAGPFTVGIRSSDETVRALVRKRFAPALVQTTDVDPNFSLRPATERDRGRPAQLAQVFAGCTLVGRHRTTDSALAQLARELQATAATADPDRPWFAGSAVLVGGRVVLAPGSLWPAWTARASQLQDLGVSLLARHVQIDAETAEAVLPPLPPGLQDPEREPDAHREQRYPITRWLLAGEPPGAASASALAVAQIAGGIVNARQIGFDGLLPALAGLRDRIDFVNAPTEPGAAARLVLAQTERTRLT